MSLVHMIDNLEKILSGGANLSAIKPHLIDLRDHAEAAERKIAELQKRYDEFVDVHEKEVAQLKQQLPQPKTEQPSVDLDVCPYCRLPKGQLVEIKADKTFGNLGLRVAFYKCTNCGKKYDREMKP